MRQKDAEEGRPGRKERRGEGHPQRAQACPGDDLTSGGGGFHSFRQQHLWSPDYQASCQVLRVQIHQPMVSTKDLQSPTRLSWGSQGSFWGSASQLRAEQRGEVGKVPGEGCR